jgi:hypothetical protein
MQVCLTVFAQRVVKNQTRLFIQHVPMKRTSKTPVFYGKLMRSIDFSKAHALWYDTSLFD